MRPTYTHKPATIEQKKRKIEFVFHFFPFCCYCCTGRNHGSVLFMQSDTSFTIQWQIIIVFGSVCSDAHDRRVCMVAAAPTTLVSLPRIVTYHMSTGLAACPYAWLPNVLFRVDTHTPPSEVRATKHSLTHTSLNMHKQPFRYVPIFFFFENRHGSINTNGNISLLCVVK